jgi:hypothetical protein
MRSMPVPGSFSDRVAVLAMLLALRERSRSHANNFVPLCASFVPWRFWKRFVIFGEMLLTLWLET